MADKKFSQFAPAPSPADEVKRGDVIVGLRAGLNHKFDFPGFGIKDGSGNYMLQYQTVGALAVNYPQLINSLTGAPVVYAANGADGDVGIWIKPNGIAGVRIDDLNFPLSDGLPGAVMVTDGAANLSLQPISTLIAVRGTANQVLVNGTSGVYLTGNLTLTTPQDIAPTSVPTFFELILTSPLAMPYGGTGKNLTPSNGGIVYTDADSMEILPGTITARQMLQSGASSAPAWSTATWPATTSINRLLYSSANDVVNEIPTGNSAILFTNSTGVPAWSAGLTNGQIMIGATGASPLPANITAGAGISITNGANSITISEVPGGMSWTEVTGLTQLMAADNGYVTNNAAQITLTLPATAAFGTLLKIVGKGAGGWTIIQGLGQSIQIGNLSSSAGVGGSVTSTNRYDSIEFICTTANTIWTALGAPQSAGLTIV